MLQEDAPDLSRCLCITFGAPPSSLYNESGPSFSTTYGGLQQSLFWNFLLADGNDLMGYSSMDIMPAVLSTIPKESSVAKKWLAAVDDIWIDSRSPLRAAQKTADGLQDLSSAGIT